MKRLPANQYTTADSFLEAARMACASNGKCLAYRGSKTAIYIVFDTPPKMEVAG